MPAGIADNLRTLFTERDFLILTSKVRIELAGSAMVAEDDHGGRYQYGEAPVERPAKVGLREWLGVEPWVDPWAEREDT